ncbi:hypothetical protein PM082_023450 [Marasmius tenuissimus]|nr:hypothetical protein PM082_023450 [Marasmius tenuissimus]
MPFLHFPPSNTTIQDTQSKKKNHIGTPDDRDKASRKRGYRNGNQIRLLAKDEFPLSTLLGDSRTKKIWEVRRLVLKSRGKTISVKKNSPK